METRSIKLLVQEFLETHTLKELQLMHGVYVSLSKNRRKISLNYDQIETKENDILAWDCRGLILSKFDFGEFPTSGDKLDLDVIVGNTQVVAFGMRRFFNYGQGSAADINWSDPKLAVLEKLDGTLCIIYYDKFTEQWCVATRSVPEADLLMDSGLFTFRTLFEKALKDTCDMSFQYFASLLDQDITYCFELTTPYNRIVVNYPDNRITLLAARSNSTFREFLPEEECLWSDILEEIPIVQAHTYTNTAELLEWISSLNPMEHEGVVVRDSNFNRIKVKNAAYVAYNKVRDRLMTSARNCVELVLLEKDDDVLPMLPPELAERLITIKSGMQKVIRHYDELYQSACQKVGICQLCSGQMQVIEKLDGDAKSKCSGCGFIDRSQKKTFALLVSQDKKLWSAPLFSMFNGKSSSMKDFLMKSKKEGSWPDGILDKLLSLSQSL